MFYISTVGSTASLWFARALGMHPEINCFHGVRSLFPVNAGGTDQQHPRQFVESLNYSYLRSEGYKVFGAAHGFLGREIKPAVDAAKGAFAAMSRHPITRLNSLFHREVHGETRDRASGKIFRIDPASIGDVFRMFREHRPLPELEPHVRKFYMLCRATVAEDMWMFDNLNERQIFRYENFTAEPEYFRKCFEYIAEGCRNVMRHIEWPVMRNIDWGPGVPRLECSDAYLAAVFGMGAVNVKSVGPNSVEQIFANWPEQFKLILAMALDSWGSAAAVERYARFGYSLPEFYTDLFHSGSLDSLLQPLLTTFPTLPRGHVRLEYRSIGEVAARMPADPGKATAADGASFLGHGFFPRRHGAAVRVELSANAFCRKDNSVALAVFRSRRNQPVAFAVERVKANGYAKFELDFVLEDVDQQDGATLDVRIGPTQPGTIIINGPEGKPPAQLGFPQLTMTELDATPTTHSRVPAASP